MSEISHPQVAAYAADRVNLPREDVLKHRAQVNGLRDRVAKKIAEDPKYGLVKSLHAGSVAKGTALRTLNDLDLAVYVKAPEAPCSDAELVPWLADRLFDATTNMERDQFEEQTHCVTVHYRGSGLDVDVVPVLYEGEPDDIGYLIKKHTGDRLKTSTRLHLDFVAGRRKAYGPELLELIRLTKWWKRQAERGDRDFKFKSFMIELIWCHLADRGVNLDDYPKALEAFFGWIVKTGLDERVTFTDYTPANTFPPRSSAPIEVLDPVNPDNNVAARYDFVGRDRILDAAQSAMDALTDARFATTKGRAVDDWQAILGPTFKGGEAMTISIAVTETFTRTHAKHLASKVISDLYQCHRYYGRPSENAIAEYQEELIVMLAGGYVDGYEFGFVHSDQRVVAWQYRVNAIGDLVGGADDRSGGVYARADVSRAEYFNHMTTSGAWSGLTAAQRRAVNAEHSIDRVIGDLPTDGIGYWQTDRTYTSGGVAVERRTFRPL